MRLTLAIVVAGALAPVQTVFAQYPTQPYPNAGGGYTPYSPQYGYGQQYGSQFGQQYGPAFNPNNFMPNIYNPQTQPLSPYLNLLRGGNVATNYFYGVRPGTVGMGNGRGGGAPFMAGGGNRAVFFPQLAMAPDPLAGEDATGPGSVLQPAGHPVVFNNTLGFFPSPFGQAGGARPGLAGVGTTRAPTRK
jgi:hypothetical protein